LYVPGKLKNAGKVLVDVGTGYYIEKVSDLICPANDESSEDATKFYGSKVEFLEANMVDLEKVINGKASNAKGSQLQSISNLLVVSDVLQQKLTSSASESA
jgi:prefoldin alpha subunit